MYVRFSKRFLAKQTHADSVCQKKQIEGGARETTAIKALSMTLATMKKSSSFAETNKFRDSKTKMIAAF